MEDSNDLVKGLLPKALEYYTKQVTKEDQTMELLRRWEEDTEVQVYKGEELAMEYVSLCPIITTSSSKYKQKKPVWKLALYHLDRKYRQVFIMGTIRTSSGSQRRV
jgi:hypothetical protein